MLVVHLGSLNSGWLPSLTSKDLVRPITILSRLFIVTLYKQRYALALLSVLPGVCVHDSFMYHCIFFDTFKNEVRSSDVQSTPVRTLYFVCCNPTKEMTRRTLLISILAL